MPYSVLDALSSGLGGRSWIPLLAEGEPPGFFSGPNLFMITAMVAIFYFLIIRPQARREQERQALLQKLAKGDRVLTQGGLHGVVARVEGDEVILKVDLEKKVQMKFNRSAVVAILGEGDGAAAAPAEGSKDAKS